MREAVVGGIVGKVRGAARRVGNRVRYFGRARLCPVCGIQASRFKPYGLVERAEAKCPHCGSLERHRLVWLFFSRRTDLLRAPRKKMLHVAPEPCLARRLSQASHIDWISADLEMPAAMVKMDITDIDFPDHTFDVIYCSHVLEHVADDRGAMRELARVLSPSGWAVLQVPITTGITFEDFAITGTLEREEAFGQWDHVRRYGHDYADRLAEAGFTVNVIPVRDLASPAEIARMRLDSAEQIFFCRKRQKG
jgi:hypothetical protein